MFKVGDFAVCPGHGVGQICEIEEKMVGCKLSFYYTVQLAGTGMKVMVPVDNGGRRGIRQVASELEISQVLCRLADHEVIFDSATWNRRYREYMDKIKSGSLLEMAEVLRSLAVQKNRKGLSFGERKMLVLCRELLAQEMALSRGDEVQLAYQEIDACFQ